MATMTYTDARETAFDTWWASADGDEFRASTLDESLCNFYEYTGLNDFDDVIRFDVAPRMVWRGPWSDPVAAVTWSYGDNFDDDARLMAFLRHCMENDAVRDLLAKETTYSNADDAEGIAEVVAEGIAHRAAFVFFNWLDLQDYAWSFFCDEYDDAASS